MDATLDSGFHSLVMLARLHGIAVEPARLQHEFGRAGAAASLHDLERAARWLGLKARTLRSEWARLAHTPLPALVRMRDGEISLLAGVDAARVLLKSAHATAPEVLAQDAFLARWSGEILLAARRAADPAEWRRFGLAWFLPVLRRYRATLLEVLVAAFVLQGLALVSPIFFQVVIDKVLVHRSLATLDVLCVGLGAVALFEAAFGALRGYLLAHATHRIDVRLGAKLFRHLLRLPLAYFEARRVGDSVARVREVENLRAFLTGSAFALAIDLPFACAFFALLAWYSPPLTGVVLASLPVYALLVATTAPAYRRLLEEKFDCGAETQAFLVETVAGIDVLKAAAAEPAQARAWEERLAAAASAGMRVALRAQVAGELAGLIQKVILLGVMWLGARLVIDGQLSVGELVAFNLVTTRALQPILRLAQWWPAFQQAGVSIRRLGDILDAPPEPQRPTGLASLARIAGGIRFEQVSFRYRAERADALQDLSFDIAPGRVIGLCGASGSGKTTLVKLIQRLHIASHGRVLIDGHDVATFDPAWLRRHVGVVPQESRLFERSIRDNIALREPGLPFARVQAAARLAGADGFILDLPEGYDTRVGEHGVALSGGQRQRIALARALVTDPRILILDEATSALDYETEAVIQANLRAIARGRTVLIVAHRASALRMADTIFVLERGRLVESGPAAVLRARDGTFARLMRHQADLMREAP